MKAPYPMADDDPAHEILDAVAKRVVESIAPLLMKPKKPSRVATWWRNAKEFWYMLTRGRFLIIARETRKILLHNPGGDPITAIELVGKPLYANVYKGVTWTEVPRGATVVTFLAGALLIWKLRQSKSIKDYSLIAVQDIVFLETIYSG